MEKRVILTEDAIRFKEHRCIATTDGVVGHNKNQRTACRSGSGGDKTVRRPDPATEVGIYTHLSQIRSI